MRKLFKVLLWIVGIVVVLLIILLGIGAYLGSGEGLEEAQKEGVSFAASASKEDCLAETAIRLAQCDTTLCMEPLNFGGVCVINAQGGQEEFCADKPKNEKEYSMGSWQQHCSVNNLSKHKCEMVFKTFSAYCSGEFN